MQPQVHLGGHPLTLHSNNNTLDLVWGLVWVCTRVAHLLPCTQWGLQRHLVWAWVWVCMLVTRVRVGA